MFPFGKGQFAKHCHYNSVFAVKHRVNRDVPGEFGRASELHLVIVVSIYSGVTGCLNWTAD